MKNDGKLNYVEGMRLERDFALSPNILSTYGLLLFSATALVKGKARAVADILVAMCRKMVGFDGTTSPLTDPYQGGNPIGVDFLGTDGRWINIKAIVDGDDSKVRSLTDRASHSVEVAKGRGLMVARHLIANKEYTMLFLIPTGNNKYVVAEMDYSEYYRRCVKEKKFCAYADGYDKCLQALGIPSEKYGVFRRVKNEKFKWRGKKKNLLTLEIRPFSPSFQSVYPYSEWKNPPTMYQYDARLGVFKPLPDEEVPF